MRYLCDSDLLIDFLKERRAAVSILTPLLEDGLWVSLIVIGEVYDGVLRERDPDEAERQLLNVLERMSVVGLDLDSVRIFGHWRGHFRTTGQKIGDNDLFIAATALRHDLTLVTRNRRHFDRIPGLRLHEADTAS